jgi:hypothetical protein
MNSLTLVLEHNAGSARLSIAYRTDQSERVDVFWHRHTLRLWHFPFAGRCASSALLEKLGDGRDVPQFSEISDGRAPDPADEGRVLSPNGRTKY